MPSLNFILPHWLYWGGLLLFPLVAMYLVAKQRKRGTAPEPTYFTAYLFWLTAGFAGIHRFYLKSWKWGILFIPLFLGVVYCNDQIREVQDDVSRTFAALEQSHRAVELATPANGAAPAAPDAKADLEKAQAEDRTNATQYAAAVAVHDFWFGWSRGLAIFILALLVIDAFLIPGMVRRARAAGLFTKPAVDVPAHVEVHEQGTHEDPTLGLHTRFTDVVEWINTKAGEYVAYWAVISVFVYYYEVIARFLYNSPTNWVHESMFLMYGMQYMVSGAYAYREDQHVRVDVVYTHLSVRGKAIADIISSVFFFIFTITMLWTGFKFAWDAVNVGETSFTEWGIQYWPVKLTIPLGAALIALQGVCKLIKDIVIVARKGAQGGT